LKESLQKEDKEIISDQEASLTLAREGGIYTTKEGREHGKEEEEDPSLVFLRSCLSSCLELVAD
jgi:hypothetical protein